MLEYIYNAISNNVDAEDSSNQFGKCSFMHH